MPSDHRAFLPPGIDKGQVKACLGLISDTHIPRFCTSLPAVLPEIFRDVDLILHAGDIGEKFVLDELSQIAPVLAVQGNDIDAESERNLPFQQIITVSGQRILLYHSHHPDWETERQMRKEDNWYSKLSELIRHGKQAEATIVAFGHTHIPMTYEQDGILLINPGAIASPSAFARQVYKTVALLFMLNNDSPVVVHIELETPKKSFISSPEWDKGFRAALNEYTASLIDADLMTGWQPFEAYMRNLMGKPPYSAVFEALYQALLRISRRCWSGEQQFISRINLLNMLTETNLGDRVPAQVISDLRAILC